MRKAIIPFLVLVIILPAAALAARAPGEKPVKVAVLPFINESVDPTFTYIGPMISDIIAHKIEATGTFELIDPAVVSSQIKYSSFDPNVLDSPDVIEKTGQALGAEVIITGFYKRSGGYLSVDFRYYDVEMRNIILGTKSITLYKNLFATCDEIVMGLVRICEEVLDAGAHSRMKTNPTENLSAYSFYADALMAVDANNTKAAMAALEQAIKVDPGFCKALRLAVDLAAKAQDPRLNQWREQSENCKER